MVTSISLRERHSTWFAALTSFAVSLARRMLDVHTDNSLKQYDSIQCDTKRCDAMLVARRDYVQLSDR